MLQMSQFSSYIWKNHHGISHEIGCLSMQHACGLRSTPYCTIWTQLNCYKGTSRDCSNCSMVIARRKCMDADTGHWHLRLYTHYYISFYLLINLYFKISYIVLPLIPVECFRPVFLRDSKTCFLFLILFNLYLVYSHMSL